MGKGPEKKKEKKEDNPGTKKNKKRENTKCVDVGIWKDNGVSFK